MQDRYVTDDEFRGQFGEFFPADFRRWAYTQGLVREPPFDAGILASEIDQHERD
ncbi:hypothetical protein BH20ACT9_BH20ACT9_11950 [soil metagenome]